MGDFIPGNPSGYAWNGNTWAPDPRKRVAKGTGICRLTRVTKVLRTADGKPVKDEVTGKNVHFERVMINVRSTKAHDSGYVGCSLRTDGDYVRTHRSTEKNASLRSRVREAVKAGLISAEDAPVWA